MKSFLKKNYRSVVGIFLAVLLVGWSFFLNSQSIISADADEELQKVIDADVTSVPTQASPERGDGSVSVDPQESNASSVDSPVSDSNVNVPGTQPSDTPDGLANVTEAMGGETANDSDASELSGKTDDTQTPSAGGTETETPGADETDAQAPEAEDSETDGTSETGEEGTEGTDAAGADVTGEGTDEGTQGGDDPAGAEETERVTAGDGTDAEPADVTVADENKFVFNYAIANVVENLNIRAAADSNAEVVGKIASNGYMKVLERGTEWTKVSSGNVTGYAYSEYLLFDDAAIERCRRMNALFVKVTADSVNIRKGPGTEFDKVSSVANNALFMFIPDSSTKEWYCIQYSETDTAYITADYSTVYLNLETAISVN